MSIYQKTQRFAEQNLAFQQILVVLNQVLDSHNIQEQRDDWAEFLLKSRMNPCIHIDTNDERSLKIVQAIKEFQVRIQEAAIPPVTYKVFVYGTLKTGGALNRYLIGQKMIAEVETLPQYRMYRHRKQGWYPCLVQVKKEGLAIVGELWEVDEACLCRLDQVEGEGTLYTRSWASLQSPYDQEVVETYLYKYKIDPQEFVDCGSCWDVSPMQEEEAWWEKMGE